jgi:hypothetical protein
MLNEYFHANKNEKWALQECCNLNMPPLDMTTQVKNNLSTFLQLSNEIRENFY